MKVEKIIKNILCCIVTLALTVALVQYAGHILDPFEAEDGLNVIEAFHKIEKDSLDVIIYGSSHAWKGCNTMTMYEDYGIEAQNYACNWQAINTSLLFLQDSFRTQSPKVVCIEVGLVDNIEQDVDLDGQIYYTRKIPFSSGKLEYLRQCFGNNPGRYASYLFPISMFHENWTKVDFENFLFPGPQPYIKSRGFCGLDIISPDKVSFSKYNKDVQADLPAESKDVLDKMVEACNEKGTKVIFLLVPIAEDYNYYDAMEKYSFDNDCEFLNLFEYIDEMGLDENTDLMDPWHLNTSGATKVGAFLSDYLVKNYNIETFKNR